LSKIAIFEQNVDVQNFMKFKIPKVQFQFQIFMLNKKKLVFNQKWLKMEPYFGRTGLVQKYLTDILPHLFRPKLFAQKIIVLAFFV